MTTSGELISRKVVIGSAEDRLTDVAAAMQQLDAHHCAVLDGPDGKFVGIVRLSDAAAFSNPINRILGDLVTPVQPLTVRSSEPAQAVADLFEQHEISEAVVLNDTGGYVGLATAESVLAWTLAELKRKSEIIELTKTRLEAASLAKDNFIAALSHELRTPLNPVVLLASEGAANSELPPAIREQFDVIAANALLEARLIDDLLDLTHVSKGTVRLNLHETDVHSALSRAVATVRPLIEAKALTLQLELGPGETTVQADAARLEQAFANLLKNAVNFTSRGGHIRVDTQLQLEVGTLAITISDDGRGLSETELQRAFEPFAPLDDAQDLGYGSSRTGIGLTLARAIIALHSGSIEASSNGRANGTSFKIELPLAKPEREEIAPLRAAVVQASVKEGAPDILLVEDHEPSRAAMVLMLRRRNRSVVAVGSVAEALVAAEENNFAIVISDVGLPDGNGYDLMRLLKERFGLTGIALTGFGTRGDLERSKAAGFMIHLTKPVQVDRLDEALAVSLAERRGR